jgi:hypothetical protein
MITKVTDLSELVKTETAKGNTVLITADTKDGFRIDELELGAGNSFNGRILNNFITKWARLKPVYTTEVLVY